MKAEAKRRGALQQLLHQIRSDDELRDKFNTSMEVLSFDATRKLWREMGLDFKDPDRVLAALRRFVEPEADIHIVCLDEYTDDDILWLVWRLFGEISLDEGEESVLAIWNWFEVSNSKEPAWRWVWPILLDCLASEEVPTLIREGMTRASAARLLALAKKWTRWSGDLDTRMEVMWPDDRDYGSWDGLHRSNLDEEDVDYRSLVEDAVRRPAFGRTWQQIVEALSPADMRALMEWGKGRYLELIKDIDASELEDPLPRLSEAMVPVEMRSKN